MLRYTESVHYALIKDLDFEDSVVLDKLKNAVLKSVLIYYQTHTARETCQMFGIPYNNEMQKILHRLAPKGLGLGGARKGCGQKKKNSFNNI